jgi:hypothetical protein
VTITHPEKVLFPDSGITKGELAAYYEMIAPIMVPHMRGRPVTMERYHRGIGAPGFFQKDVSKGFPDWLERVEVPKKGGSVHHPIVTDTRSLWRRRSIRVVSRPCIGRNGTAALGRARRDVSDSGGQQFEPVIRIVRTCSACRSGRRFR